MVSASHGWTRPAFVLFTLEDTPPSCSKQNDIYTCNDASQFVGNSGSRIRQSVVYAGSRGFAILVFAGVDTSVCHIRKFNRDTNVLNMDFCYCSFDLSI